MRCFSEGRRLVEVAALGLPLPTLGAVAVAALAGPFDLGGGPLEAGADLVGFQLGDRPLVPQARSRLDETAAYIDQFTAAERRAGTWWAKVEIPLSLIEGITIPAYGIAAKEVLGAGEFATENADDLRLARERAAVWLTDLRTLNRASPTLTAVLISRTLTFVLSGDFWHDFLRGVEGRDVAFLIGRIIRGSLEAPSFSFDILLEVIGHCLDIWTALHALPNVIRGIGERAVDEARVAVERALRDLEPPLTAEQVRLVARELLRPETRDALVQLGRSTLGLAEPLGRLIMAARVGGFGSQPVPDPRLLIQP